MTNIKKKRDLRKHSTVFDSSLPISIVRRHRGIISVDSRKLITSVSSTCKEITAIFFLKSSKMEKQKAIRFI